MQTAAATSKVAQAVASSTKTMSAMQAAMNPQEVSKTMQQFAKENAKMGEARGECVRWRSP
jgi:hypothetical protein